MTCAYTRETFVANYILSEYALRNSDNFDSQAEYPRFDPWPAHLGPFDPTPLVGIRAGKRTNSQTLHFLTIASCRLEFVPRFVVGTSPTYPFFIIQGLELSALVCRDCYGGTGVSSGVVMLFAICNLGCAGFFNSYIILLCREIGAAAENCQNKVATRVFR